MSKKSKRRVTTSTPREVKESSSLSSSYRSAADDFKPDYSYVKKDLRRIGVLAGSFLAVLLILSFFLR